MSLTIRLRTTAFFVLAMHFVAAHAFAELPSRLSDQEFWKMVTEFSEADGTFHSENLVSNEAQFQAVIPSLLQSAVPGRAYVGVGSEQNFTYIAALRPSMAFITDIRRGNLDLHLIYKVLFEISANRTEFVSRLFSRKLPAGLNANSTAAEIFAAAGKATPDQEYYEQNLKEIKSQLTVKHGFKLSNTDFSGVDFVYSSWFKAGPGIHYELTGTGNFGGAGAGGGFPTYAELMTAKEGKSYLASDDAFKIVKDLETRNMLVPVVGNFAGPKALRAVGAYLKEKGVTVGAFYVSNVEQYLREDGIWEKFCSNASTLPADASSTFIRSTRGGFSGQGQFPGFGRGRAGRGGGPAGGFASALAPMKRDLAACAR